MFRDTPGFSAQLCWSINSQADQTGMFDNSNGSIRCEDQNGKVTVQTSPPKRTSRHQSNSASEKLSAASLARHTLFAFLTVALLLSSSLLTF
jgi:hypothetical protein